MIRLAIRCRPDVAERVLAELVELAPGGVEEDHGDGYVELAVYGPPGELPELPDLGAAAGGDAIEITSTEVPDDWAERWRDFHEPVWVDRRLLVRPSWAEPPYAGDRPEVEVVIDPGRAFGTGAHTTTRMCLELMLERADGDEARGSLADLGTGSGVLAIAAARLGWSPVVGVDSEPAALEAAGANAKSNGVEIELRRANLRRDVPPAAETLVANLTAPLLIEVAARLAGAPRTLICSGLLATESDRVATAFGDAGLTVAERRVVGEWAALRLERAFRGASG